MTGSGERKSVRINRAPVLTLWAAVVAQRLGFSWTEALTLGRAVAGLNAQSKGRRLGIYRPAEESPAKKKKHLARDEQLRVDLLGRGVPVRNTESGLRALSKERPIDPASVKRYLESKFGDALPDARAAMTALAKAQPKDELAESAYELYEAFRPSIPAGKAGWGAAGRLDLMKIRRMAVQA